MDETIRQPERAFSCAHAGRTTPGGLSVSQQEPEENRDGKPRVGHIETRRYDCTLNNIDLIFLLRHPKFNYFSILHLSIF